MMDTPDLRTNLDSYYQSIKTIILDKQHPVTGLLPASTAVTTHGDYTDAWVRDNVYSIMAVWGLALAYRRLDDDGGREYALEQSCVKLMRGLLQAMMKQAHKVERFKQTQGLYDALHAKYKTDTGDPVVEDDAWGHLQIDATSIFLLTLAQMIASGLHIIWTEDEVNFIQNLVYYIERAYRAPDFGIWERGAKMNSGSAELNASSLGMAKAALEALNGFNLFGARGGQSSVIHVIPDNIAHAEIVLHSMLPRESVTKEVDAALLSVISFPAFAIHKQTLVERTRDEIVGKLQGRYGLKRFLRDGHQTVLEDELRLHYEPEELKRFEHIESEWPLFYTYLYLDGLFRNDEAQIAEYEQLLEGVLVEQNGSKLLPELYYVPNGHIEAEKAEPHSQPRVPNENVPLVWAQSLYFVGKLLRDGLIHPTDIDPLRRHRHLSSRRPVVQIAFLAEDRRLQADLAAHGVLTETLDALAPFQVVWPDEVTRAFGRVGRNEKLGLNGRSSRSLKSLTTSRLYKLGGETVVCLSPFFMQQKFYLAYDLDFMVERFKSELAYVHRHWTQLGRPTVTVLLTHGLLQDDRTPFYELVQQIQAGRVDGVPVHSDHLAQLLPTAAFERIDELHGLELAAPELPESRVTGMLGDDTAVHQPLSQELELSIEFEQDVGMLTQRLAHSENLYEQIEILEAIAKRRGLETAVTLHDLLTSSVRDLLENVYERAGRLRLWAVVRRAAGLLQKVEIDLLSAVSAMLVRQKQIQVGRAYSDDSLILRPLPSHQLLQKIEKFSRDDARETVLTQEMLIYLGLLIKAKPELFDQMFTIRISYLILLLTGQLMRERKIPQATAYDQLMHMPPSEIQNRLQRVLEQYQSSGNIVMQIETLEVGKSESPVTWDADLDVETAVSPEESWLTWRQAQGTLTRVPPQFYNQLWELFRSANGLIIGNRFEQRNCLESRLVLSDMTPGEAAFAHRIEQLLNRIVAPEYRQLNVETLRVLISFFHQNPTLRVNDYLVTDTIIGHAVRLGYLDKFPDRERNYNHFKGNAWSHFYELPPIETSNYLAQSLQFLLTY